MWNFPTFIVHFGSWDFNQEHENVHDEEQSGWLVNNNLVYRVKRKICVKDCLRYPHFSCLHHKSNAHFPSKILSCRLNMRSFVQTGCQACPPRNATRNGLPGHWSFSHNLVSSFTRFSATLLRVIRNWGTRHHQRENSSRPFQAARSRAQLFGEARCLACGILARGLNNPRWQLLWDTKQVAPCDSEQCDLLSCSVLLPHDSARPHTSAKTQYLVRPFG